jgi:CBS domain-containing protein
MVQRVREVMTAEPVSVSADAGLDRVAEVMRDRDIGDVVVGTNGGVIGILTDRDLVIRGLASGQDVGSLTAGDICTGDVISVGSEDSVATAVDLMRNRAIRRLPVIDDGQLVGIVSIGDLATERDPDSALAGISAAPPNK